MECNRGIGVCISESSDSVHEEESSLEVQNLVLPQTLVIRIKAAEYPHNNVSYTQLDLKEE